MNSEQALNNAVRNPDFLTLSGSRLYGVDTASSDWDYRGFTIPPYEYLLGIKQFKDMDVSRADHKVYGLKRYLDLVLSGDPQATELLFVPERMWKCISSIGREVLDLRPLIVSNRIYKRVMGFGYSEWRKAMGDKLVIGERTKDEDDIIGWIRDKKHWEKERMDKFVEWMEEDKERKLVPNQKVLGEKRKKEFDDYGFGVSSACHAIRLSDELVELMTKGFISFPRPNAEMLKGIRHGAYTKDDVIEVYEDLRVKAERARDDSVLQDKPDDKEVWHVYGKLVSRYLLSDKRFEDVVQEVRGE